VTNLYEIVPVQHADAIIESGETMPVLIGCVRILRGKEIVLVNVVPEVGRSERKAEAIAEAKT
jgi:hypothetical protein